MQRNWMLTSVAMVFAVGVAQAQTIETASLAELGFEDELQDSQTPHFTLAIGRSPTQAGFALDIGGGVPHGWALLTLQRAGAPAESTLVALDMNGVARVLKRNYELDEAVRATCTIPRQLGTSAASATTLTTTIPAATTMPQGPSTLVGTASIVITEIMKDPSFVTDSAGEWFEVHNLTAQPINVEGWKIKDSGTNSHTIHATNGVWIPQHSYFVFGLNSTTATNGGVDVGYKYPTSFSLGNAADDIQLLDAAGILVDTASYDDGIFWPDEAGKSLNVNRAMVDPLVNDDGSNWCSALTFVSSSNTDLGTPHRANNTCP